MDFLTFREQGSGTESTSLIKGLWNMIDLEFIRSFFPPVIARESRFDRYMLKEYALILRLTNMELKGL